MSRRATRPRPGPRLRTALALSLTTACGAAEPPREAVAAVEAPAPRAEAVAARASVAVAPAPVRVEPVAEPLPEPRAVRRFEEVDVAGTACATIPSLIYTFGFSPDERTFFTLYDSGDQCVYQVREGRLVNQRRIAAARPTERDGWPNHPFAVPLSPDGRWGLSFSYDDEPLIWRMGTRQPPWRVAPFDGEPVHAALLTDDALVLQGPDGEVAVWSLTSRRRLQFTVGLARRAEMAIRSDGGALALAAGSAIAAWDLATGEELLPRTLTWGRISAIAFLRDTGRLVAVDQDGGYHEWDLSTTAPREPVVHRELGGPLAGVWVLDGGAAIVGAGAGEVSIYRARGPERAIEVRRLTDVRTADDSLQAYASPAGGRLVLHAADTTWIVRTADARVESTLSGDTCRQGPWAAGETGSLVSHGAGGLCVWLP